MSGTRILLPRRGRWSAAGALVVGAAIGLASTSATADTWTNSSGNGLWQIGANWFDTSVPLASDPVTFPAPGPTSRIVTLPAGTTVVAQSLSFEDDYTLTAGRLDMTGAPISVAAGKVATINSQIGSSNGILDKSGDGILVLGGNNSASLGGNSTLRINAGTLRVSSDASLGGQFGRVYTFGTLEITGTFSSTRRFEPSGGTIRVTAGNTLSLTANDQFGFSNTDALYKDGEGTLKITGHSSRFGTTYLVAGVTRLEGDMGYGPISIGNAAILESAPPSGFVSNKVILGTGSIFRGVGTITASNLVAASGDVSPTISTSQLDDVLGLSMSTFGGTAASVITINGLGAVSLGMSTNYPGGWDVTRGTLRVTSSVALGSGMSAIPIRSGGAVLVNNVPVSRSFNLNDGSALRGTGTSGNVTGFLNIAPGAQVAFGAVLVNDIFTITGPPDRLNGGAGGTITINGPGTVLIPSATSYAGSWNLASGTLRVQNTNSLGTGSTPVVINPGATLETGAGTFIPRDIDFRGGAIRGGRHTGTITVAPGAAVAFQGSPTLGDSPNDLTGGGPGTSIHMNSFGVTTLTQSSDVVAEWAIDSATLAISDDAQLGALANPITFNHSAARLRTDAPISSARYLAFSQGTFDSNGFDSTFGDMSGGAAMKAGAGTLQVNQVRVSSLKVSAGTLKVKPDGSDAGVGRMSTLTIDDGDMLDLADNDLVIDGGNLAEITSHILAGRLITSAATPQTTLAATVNDDGAGQLLVDTFSGQAVGVDDVLVKYTYVGDIDFDGRVTIDDYFRADLAWANAIALGWVSADFDYSGGPPTPDDFFRMDVSFLEQGTALAAGPASAAAVPEPAPAATLGMLVVITAGARRSRGRRQLR